MEDTAIEIFIEGSDHKRKRIIQHNSESQNIRVRPRIHCQVRTVKHIEQPNIQHQNNSSTRKLVFRDSQSSRLNISTDSLHSNTEVSASAVNQSEAGAISSGAQLGTKHYDGEEHSVYTRVR